jgi:transcriptional regulator with XRE-family HTH domain
MLNRAVKDAGPIVAYAYGMETMGTRIRQLRVARGLTQPELGELCGVSKSAVSQWEDGSTEDIKLKPFLRLCEALQTDAHYLVFGPQREDPSSTGRHRRPVFPPR